MKRLIKSFNVILKEVIGVGILFGILLLTIKVMSFFVGKEYATIITVTMASIFAVYVVLRSRYCPYCRMKLKRFYQGIEDIEKEENIIIFKEQCIRIRFHCDRCQKRFYFWEAQGLRFDKPK